MHVHSGPSLILTFIVRHAPGRRNMAATGSKSNNVWPIALGD